MEADAPATRCIRAGLPRRHLRLPLRRLDRLFQPAEARPGAVLAVRERRAGRSGPSRLLPEVLPLRGDQQHVLPRALVPVLPEPRTPEQTLNALCRQGLQGDLPHEGMERRGGSRADAPARRCRRAHFAVGPVLLLPDPAGGPSLSQPRASGLPSRGFVRCHGGRS